MRLIVVLLLVMSIVTVACSKKDITTYPALADYYPLKVGKVFTYLMDSTVRTNFGVNLVEHYYLAKDSVESQSTDAQGRISYRIFRYLRDTAQLQPWTYVATNTTIFDATKRQVEVVDNLNFRYIVLHEPINEGFSWPGNSYIEIKDPYTYLDAWNYTFQNINQPYTVRKGKFDSTITVLQTDEVSPPGPFSPNAYQQTNYAVEVYAKGVGLIYKEFLHKTWNIIPPSPGSWEDNSYGVKLNLVDYK